MSRVTFLGSSAVEQSTVNARSLLLIQYLYMPEKRTYADRAEYNKKAVSKRRKKLKEMSIEYGGSKCQICGYNKCSRALNFHHTDASKNDFGLSAKGLTRSWEKIKAELDKCILVCANCHMELHEGITQLPTVK